MRIMNGEKNEKHLTNLHFPGALLLVSRPRSTVWKLEVGSSSRRGPTAAAGLGSNKVSAAGAGARPQSPGPTAATNRGRCRQST